MQPNILDYLKPRGFLANIQQKLSKKQIKIAYVGASVTKQKKGYAPNLHKLINGKFKKNHIRIDAGQGAVASLTGLMLLDEVIKQKPDLCFFEYFTGDVGTGQRPKIVKRRLELIIRKLMKINCQIVFLYLYRKDGSFKKSKVLDAYEQVADYYHIPSINQGAYMDALFKNKTYKVDQIYRDICHTIKDNKQGMIAAKPIFEAFLKLTPNKEKNLLQLKNKTWMFETNKKVKTKVIPMDKKYLKDKKNFSIHKVQKYNCYKIDSTNDINLKSKAYLVGLIIEVGPDSGIIQINSKEIQLWDPWSHYYRFMTHIFNGINAKNIKIKLTEKPVDYKSCRRKFNFKGKKHLRIIGFMISNKKTL